MAQTGLFASQKRTFIPTYQGLRDLRFGFHSRKIPIRILAEWDSRSLDNYYEIMMNYIILDAQDNQYWAVIDFADRARFRPLLCVGLLYSMSDFRIAPATAATKPINTDRVIILSKKTTIADLMYTCGINRFKFNLVSRNTFLSRLGDATKLTDACGVIKSVGSIDYRTNDIERLDLTLVMSSLEELKISLWGIKSAIFEMNFGSHRHKNVVVIITALLAKQNMGTVYLSSTQSTTICFQPKYQDTNNLGRRVAEEYGEFICPVPQETLFGTLLHPSNDPPTSTLSEILATPLWIHQKYCCSVTIVNVILFEQTRTIYCNSCKHHLGMNEETYYCPCCGRNYVTQMGSMGIPMLVKDGNCTAIIIIRDRELKQLTGYHVNDFLAYYRDVKDNYRTHCCIRRIMGSTCTFELELAPSTYSNSIGDLLIKRVLQYTQLRINQPLP